MGILATAVLWAGAHGVTVFSDNFDGENGGSPQLNYASFAQWSVSDGTVDLIGNGSFDYYPGNGLYVDLDGTSADSGILTSIPITQIAGGIYTLTFDLGGSQSFDTNTVRVLFGLIDESITLASDDDLSTYSFSFMAIADGLASVSFENNGGDNHGLILDNVSVDASVVPEPVTLAALGLGALALIRRHRKA
jgi:hypothetical protein